MNPFKILALVVVFGAVAFIVNTAIERFVPWWNRRTATYVTWIVSEHQRMFESMDARTARRLVNLSIFGLVLVGYALSGPIVAVLFGIAGAYVPRVLVNLRSRQYTQRLDNQLIEALILMANALKSGLSLLQAIELAADELKPPIGHEFNVLLKEIRLGRGIDEALTTMAERLKLPDLEIAVHSIVTLRETGGNLAETFATVANTIAERKKVEDKIRTVTSQGVYQGVMLCAMPWVMGALFYVMDPAYMAPMFKPLGYLVWVAVAVLDAIGMWAILKVVKIDV